MNIDAVIDRAARKLLEFDLGWCYNFEIIRDQMFWIPYTLPRIINSEPHLFFACTSVCYLFYIDDVKEKHPDFYENAAKIHDRKLTMSQKALEDKKYDVVHYYEQLLQQTLTKFNYELFHEDLLSYILTEDSRNKKIVKFDTLQEYLDKRLINICIRPFFITLFDSLGLDYPMALNDRFVKAIHSITIINDLHSYHKELKERDPYNALLILQQQHNDLSGNIAGLLDLVNSYMAESFLVNDKLIREILVSAQIGNTAWHTMSKRYKIFNKLIVGSD